MRRRRSARVLEGFVNSPVRGLEAVTFAFTSSPSAFPMLARKGFLSFCRVRRVPGKNALRLVDRPLPEPTES